MNLRLGELRARQRRFGEAATHFRRALELQPQDPSILFKIAQASFDDGRHADARRVLAAAAALAPRNAAILRLDADLMEAASDWAGLERVAIAWRTAAAAALDEAERLDPKNSAMLSGQAILHMWKGELETARNYCRRPLDVNRGVVTAYKTLAHLLDLRLPDEDVARLREVVGDDATRTADVSRLTIAVVERHPR